MREASAIMYDSLSFLNTEFDVRQFSLLRPSSQHSQPFPSALNGSRRYCEYSPSRQNQRTADATQAEINLTALAYVISFQHTIAQM
jgi:hypothetical protein